MNINLIYFWLTGGVPLKFNLKQRQIPYLAKFYTRTFLCKISVRHGCDLEEYVTVFWEEIFCIIGDISCRFGHICCPHLQGRKLLLHFDKFDVWLTVHRNSVWIKTN
jgi:hypothetical protein